MITFKIAGERHKLPTVWGDVTYEQYIYHIIPRNLTESIHCFTGIPMETLSETKFNNLEKISIALAFMAITPDMTRKDVVGPYVMPGDPKMESLAQFEDLRKCIKQYPQKERAEWDYIDLEKEAEIYLTACAIYCQKLRDGYYDLNKVESVKDELRKQSAIAVLSNGGFFLSKALNISSLSMTRFQKTTRVLKRWLQELPGYQKTLDFLLHSRTRRLR